MRTSPIVFLVAGWLAASSAFVSAQSDWTAVQKLTVGTAIRVSAGARRATGQLHIASDTEIAVLNGVSDIARFARKDVDLVEEVIGEPHPKRRGAVKGALWSLLLAIPATISAEMGGMEHKYLPLAYCFIICGGAAIGAWIADDAATRVVYRR